MTDIHSYRYPGDYGWIMIGAANTQEALREAEKTLEGSADPSQLDVYNHDRGNFVPVT